MVPSWFEQDDRFGSILALFLHAPLEAFHAVACASERVALPVRVDEARWAAAAGKASKLCRSLEDLAIKDTAADPSWVYFFRDRLLTRAVGHFCFAVRCNG